MIPQSSNSNSSSRSRTRSNSRRSACSAASAVLLSCLLLARTTHAFVVPLATPTTVSRTALRVGFMVDDLALPVAERETRTSATAASLSDSQQSSSAMDFWGPVLSTSALITGNTVGAGCLVMPELAQGPGLASTLGLLAAAYGVNLVSGLVLAQVALKQHEACLASDSSKDVPASFKEFAQVTLGPQAASLIVGLSLFVNACVLSFDLTRAGVVGASLLADGTVSPELITAAWTAGLAALVATQSTARLSQVASVCVTGLFVSFAGLLVPGLAQVAQAPQQLFDTLLSSGTASDWGASVAHVAPILLMATVYQNIVPAVCKILEYNRQKTVTALVLGSGVPVLMYAAWCICSLGGGVGGAGLGGLVTVFSLATLSGSSLGCTMSLSEEFQAFQTSESGGTENEETVATAVAPETGGVHPVSAVLATGLPLAAALALQHSGGDMTVALSWAGSIGSPLLYGAIPALMAMRQRQQSSSQQQSSSSTHLVPAASLPVLGILSTGFVGQEVFAQVGQALAHVI